MLVPTRFSTTAERALAICKYGPSFSDRCTDTAVFGLWACGHGTRIERNKALERRQLEVPQKAVMAYHHSAACWCAVAGGPATGELPSKATADLLRTCRQGRLEPATRPAGRLCSRRRLPAFEGCACGQTALSRRSAGPRRQSQRRSSRASGGNSFPQPRPRPRWRVLLAQRRCERLRPLMPLKRRANVPAGSLGCGAAFPGTDQATGRNGTVLLLPIIGILGLQGRGLVAILSPQ